MAKYLIALEASRDLDEIISYFQTRSIEAGDRFIQKFNNEVSISNNVS